jgi:hypothetical protein
MTESGTMPIPVCQLQFKRNILDVNTFLIVRPFGLCSAASDIKGHVEAAARELSLERFANFESELYQVILIIIR